MMSRNGWIFAGAGILAFGCLVFMPCGIAVGLWLGTGKGLEPPAVLAAKAIESKRPETFQELQDHLAKRGLKTSRAAGRAGSRLGMWFEAGNGAPIAPDRMASLNIPEILWQNLDEGAFFVEDMGTAERANQEVARVADVQQRRYLAAGQFVIIASNAKQQELSRLLR